MNDRTHHILIISSLAIFAVALLSLCVIYSNIAEAGEDAARQMVMLGRN